MRTFLLKNITYHFLIFLNTKNCYYLVPETAEINAIKIYKCIKFPDKWVFYKKLLKSNSVDHIIFKSNKYWYLLNNEKSFNKIYCKLVGYKSQPTK